MLARLASLRSASYGATACAGRNLAAASREGLKAKATTPSQLPLAAGPQQFLRQQCRAASALSEEEEEERRHNDNFNFVLQSVAQASQRASEALQHPGSKTAITVRENGRRQHHELKKESQRHKAGERQGQRPNDPRGQGHHQQQGRQIGEHQQLQKRGQDDKQQHQQKQRQGGQQQQRQQEQHRRKRQQQQQEQEQQLLLLQQREAAEQLLAPALAPPRTSQRLAGLLAALKRTGPDASDKGRQQNSPEPLGAVQARAQLAEAAAQGDANVVLAAYEELLGVEAQLGTIELSTEECEHVMASYLQQAEEDDRAVEGLFAVYARMRRQHTPQSNATEGMAMKACARMGNGRRALSNAVRLLAPESPFRATEDFLCDLIIALSKGRQRNNAQAYYEMLRRSGFTGTRDMYEVLIGVQLHAKQFGRAMSALGDMLEHGFVPTPVTVRKMMLAAVENSQPENTYKLLRLLVTMEVRLSADELLRVLRCAAAGIADAAGFGHRGLALAAWGLWRRWEYAPTEASYSLLVMALAKSGADAQALAALAEMEEAEIRPSRKLIQSLARILGNTTERLDAAYYVLEAMRDGRQAAQKGEEGEEEKEKEQQEEEQRGGNEPAAALTPKPPLAGLNAVVLGCAAAGSKDRAFATAQAMRESFGVQLDTDTYNALILAALKVSPKRGSDGRDATTRASVAFALLSDMREEGVARDVDTYYLLFKALCSPPRLPENFEQLQNGITLMEEDGVEPDENVALALSRGFHAFEQPALGGKWGDLHARLLREREYKARREQANAVVRDRDEGSATDAAAERMGEGGSAS